MKQLNVHFLPTLMNPDEVAGKTVVVIDVLRASTTICYALEAGAKYVVPCLEIQDTLDQAKVVAKAGDTPLLGGERGGKRIEDFDLGNSPSEYTSANVKDRAICFSTTNGTKAIQQSTGATRLVIGGFVNLTSVYRSTEPDDHVELLCAGTNGAITREDVLFAGAFVKLAEIENADITLNDEARLASDAWNRIALERLSLNQVLRHTSGGENLVALGYDDDLRIAAEIDALQVVPELDLENWQIRAS